MSISMNVKIQADNTDEIKEAAREAVITALEAVGLQAEGYAKRLCPVDTGNLRNSITHETNAGALEEYIGTNVEYAKYVEYGTSKTKAQPYLKPAANNHADEYKEIFQYYLENS